MLEGTPDVTLFNNYQTLARTFDEYIDERGKPREVVQSIAAALDELGSDELRTRQGLANSAFIKAGITFNVYSHTDGSEKVFPFDLVPRVVDGPTFDRLEQGLKQRILALNMFLCDVYGEQRILNEGVVPREMVESCPEYLPKLRGIRPRGGVFVHVAGIDLIRDEKGEFLVLEDNVRTPSGVSYVLENRSIMKRLLPKLLERAAVRSVDEYPTRLKRALYELSPRSEEQASLVVLTPGAFNSAYFEHSFLARRMGCPLVQGSDLFIHDDHVFVKTVAGPKRVDVIYKRIDDTFLDPEAFRPDSLLGVPGIFRAYAAGNVTLANALGNGVADDKGIYPFVPDMIRFYLSEEPILGQVHTYICAREKERDKVLSQLNRMVVKAVNGSGGYGMLLGFSASQAQLDEFALKLKKSPREYIAQPLVDFSTCPTLDGTALGARRVDLRPFAVTGNSTWVLPGGLTRVAMVEGSYVVNSSQGGGSKDTWILRS